MSKEFTHLSLASAYSFKYGSSHPEQLVQRAAQFNMKSLALTDQNNLAGAIRFAQSCESFGIKPRVIYFRFLPFKQLHFFGSFYFRNNCFNFEMVCTKKQNLSLI